MTPRETIVHYLKQFEHVTTDALNPALTFWVQVDVAKAHSVQAMGYPVGNEKPPTAYIADDSEGYDWLEMPLEMCLVGTDFHNEATGRVYAIGIDFDGPNHDDGHTLEELDAIIGHLRKLDYCHIYRSRSGQGYHIIIPLGRPIFGAPGPLGDALVAALAARVGEPELPSYVCRSGGNMYMTSPTAGQNGFQLVQKAEASYPDDLQPKFKGGDFDGDPAPLGPEHRRLLDWLKVNKTCEVKQTGEFWWVHTADLQAAHTALNLRGDFHTDSPTQHEGTANCWMLPKSNGAWRVGRRGLQEPTWQKGNGYHWCDFDEPPDFSEWRERIGHDWNLDDAQSFAAKSGQTLPDPGIPVDGLTADRDGDFVIFTAAVRESDKPTSSAWKKKSKRRIVCRISCPVNRNNPAENIRVTHTKDGHGTMIFRRLYGDYWHRVSMDDASRYLTARGMTAAEANFLLTTDHPLQLVNVPFGPEWITSREWNHGAVKLKFEPAPGESPTYQKILDHVGAGLTEVVSANEWCKANGILSGPDYLLHWDSRILKAPLERLAMLALYSRQQNCGKSIFAAKWDILSTGYAPAATALASDFSLGLKNAIVADLDDINVTGPMASKLLTILTSDTISLVGKGKDEIIVANSTHFVHSTNKLEHIKIGLEDDRTVVIKVDPLDDGGEIPRRIMRDRLIAEAPAYLHALRQVPDLTPFGRFYLPVLSTRLKLDLIGESIGEPTDEQRKLFALVAKVVEGKKHAEFTADGAGIDKYLLRDNRKYLQVAFHKVGYQFHRTDDKQHKKPVTYTLTQYTSEMTA